MKISVIVPIYNAEKYLRECIDSVLNQTFEDFELLLINDGSTDNSGAICSTYAQKDNRIRVFDKENGGVSSARNIGLDNAIGEWISFIDADDHIGKNYLQDFVKVGLNKEELIVQELVKDGKIKKSYDYGNWSLEDIEILLNNNDIFSNGFPFCKLYNLAVIKENFLKFNKNLRFCEDLVFYLEYISYIKSIKFINHASYFYTINEISATSKTYTFEQYTTVLTEIKKQTERIVCSMKWSQFNQITNMFGMILFLALTSIFYKENNYSSISRIKKLKELSTNDKFNFIKKYIQKRSTKTVELFFYNNLLKGNYKIVNFLFPIYFNIYKYILNAK